MQVSFLGAYYNLPAPSRGGLAEKLEKIANKIANTELMYEKSITINTTQNTHSTLLIQPFTTTWKFLHCEKLFSPNYRVSYIFQIWWERKYRLPKFFEPAITPFTHHIRGFVCVCTKMHISCSTWYLFIDFVHVLFCWFCVCVCVLLVSFLSLAKFITPSHLSTR